MKDSIGTLIPQTHEAMRHILRLAPDEILSSGSAVYSVLEFAERNQDEDTKKIVLSDLKYVLARDDTTGYTALNWALKKFNAKIEGLLTERLTQDIALRDVEGNVAPHRIQFKEQSGPQKRKADPDSHKSKRRGSEMYK